MITEKVTVAEEAITPGDKEDGKREHGEGMGHEEKTSLFHCTDF